MFILRMQRSLSKFEKKDVMVEISCSIIFINKENDKFFIKAETISGADSIALGQFSSYAAAEKAMDQIYTQIASGSNGITVPEENY